jgi:Uma2 family endonuclease
MYHRRNDRGRDAPDSSTQAHLRGLPELPGRWAPARAHRWGALRDALVILDDQRDVLTDKHVRGAPAVVIEILSPGTRRRDETLKRQLYARAGVREYWIVDPDRHSIEVCRHTPPGRLDTAADLRARQGDVLTSPLLPGFPLALASVFDRRVG